MIVLPKKGPWTEAELSILREGYVSDLSAAEIAALTGRSTSAVRNKAYQIKITKRDNDWTPEEIALLRAAYEAVTLSPDIGLTELSRKLGRDRANVCRKARGLGLTDNSRKSVAERKDRRKFKTPEELREFQSARAKRAIQTNGHPRGMAGKKHTQETKDAISKASKALWDGMTPAQKFDQVTRQQRTMAANNNRNAGRSRGSWKAGWREIGGKRNYYRSRWEANYARYLEWLKERDEIRDWQHEPETFWFDAIKRGVRSYKPDFRVWEIDGSTPLYEIKGWMCARSKTTLKRMAKYHPEERVIVVREKEYNAVARKVGTLIEGWETSGRADRL